MAAGKLHAVCVRFEVRDFIDVHAILHRPEGRGALPSEELKRERMRTLVHDLVTVDPGLNAALVGQALARGLDRPIIGRFPLRLLVEVDEQQIQRTLQVAVDACARLARERMKT